MVHRVVSFFRKGYKVLEIYTEYCAKISTVCCKLLLSLVGCFGLKILTGILEILLNLCYFTNMVFLSVYLSMPVWVANFVSVIFYCLSYALPAELSHSNHFSFIFGVIGE